MHFPGIFHALILIEKSPCTTLAFYSDILLEYLAITRLHGLSMHFPGIFQA
jgi:hypothetical protein